MDLPYAQISRLKSYVEIRECYHRLYDYEANNQTEDKEEREKLNRLYDGYVLRWGYFNQKANTDVIKMDATGMEMLFLERSENGKYIKADILRPFHGICRHRTVRCRRPWRHWAHRSQQVRHGGA